MKFGEEEFNDLKVRFWFKIYFYRFYFVYCNNFVGWEEFYEDICGNGCFYIGVIKDFLFILLCLKIFYLVCNWLMESNLKEFDFWLFVIFIWFYLIEK